MSRPQVHVRRVAAQQQADFAGLWRSARAEAGLTADTVTRMTSDQQVRAALARDDVHAFLAVVDERPVGLMVLVDTSLFSLSDAPCVSVDQLYVAPHARRMGVARALLGAAATHADLVGAGQVSISVPSQSRDTNRFFARLGFTPLVVKRVTATAALHLRLAGTKQTSRADSVLLHRRRSLRARATRTATAAR
ncbi:MAG TPA: GNAT family N-acetyltransferase [Dermatophilaceae bacterium]|nr:GNAT family N-acetyltransferase [Dermatophilaceae bacterium]